METLSFQPSNISGVPKGQAFKPCDEHSLRTLTSNDTDIRICNFSFVQDQGLGADQLTVTLHAQVNWAYHGSSGVSASFSPHHFLSTLVSSKPNCKRSKGEGTQVGVQNRKHLAACVFEMETVEIWGTLGEHAILKAKNDGISHEIL